MRHQRLDEHLGAGPESQRRAIRLLRDDLPKMFEQFVLPHLSDQCRKLDWSLYHWDGPGEIPAPRPASGHPRTDGHPVGTGGRQPPAPVRRSGSTCTEGSRPAASAGAARPGQGRRAAPSDLRSPRFADRASRVRLHPAEADDFVRGVQRWAKRGRSASKRIASGAARMSGCCC